MKNLKKVSRLFYLSLVALTMVFTFTSCNNDDNDNQKPSVFKFNPERLELEVGKTAIVTISGGTAPYSALPNNLKTATAKVAKNIITITGVKKGIATIVVTDKNRNKGNISVLVKDALVSGLDFDKKSVEVGVEKENVVTIKGGTAPYTIESKDIQIATASEKDGKVTVKGVKAGTTSIVVTDKNKKSGVVSVTVK